MKYSIIVPVFNRPDEVSELLESLTHQTVKDFEVIIVEDGSKIPCKEVCDALRVTLLPTLLSLLLWRLVLRFAFLCS